MNHNIEKLSVEKVAEFTGHRDSVFSLHYDTKTQTLFSGSADGLIAKWLPLKHTDGTGFVNLNTPVWCFLHNKNQLIAGTSTGNIHVIDLISKKEIHNIEAHTSGVFSLTTQQNLFFSGDSSGCLNIWDSDWKLIRRIRLSNKSLRQIICHPTQNKLAIASSDSNIYITDFEGKILQQLSGHTLSVFSVCFSSDGNSLVSGGRDAVLNLWSGENLKLKKTINAHWYSIHSISLSPCGQLFATGSMDKTIKLWDSSTLTLLKVIDFEKNNAHTNCVNKVLWISSNELISCSDDRRILYFKITK